MNEINGGLRLQIMYSPIKSTQQLVREILEAARPRNQEGAVAQYLVGAKLQLRFPNIAVSNESYSTADVQLNRPGDFLVGDTAFHITVHPMPQLYEKCQRNLEQGYRVYLLVRQDWLEGARQNAEAVAPGRIAVESIESFVGQNLDELSVFSSSALARKVFALLEMYNQRVDAVENDKSMLIEIPQNLLRAVRPQ